MTERLEIVSQKRDAESFLIPSLIALLIFCTIAVLQSFGLTQAWDEALLRSLRTSDPAVPFASGLLLPLMHFITWFGDVTALIIISSISTIALFYFRRNEDAALLLLSALGGATLMLVLKEGFARPRPDVVPALVYVGTLSFPSGHALMSVAVYVILLLLLMRVYPRYAPHLKIGLVAFIVLIGFSRMYFGVHYPSDIVAGWAMGAFWVLMCHLILAVSRARKAVHQGG